ncbi:uncharacterized protein [Halyomorpha halys]|uniref:uncharacterized protein n=1 Tax=Halyomorpha halys TaxID=286706 RepID=UPI0034D21F82
MHNLKNKQCDKNQVGNTGKRRDTKSVINQNIMKKKTTKKQCYRFTSQIWSGKIVIQNKDGVSSQSSLNCGHVEQIKIFESPDTAQPVLLFKSRHLTLEHPAKTEATHNIFYIFTSDYW